MCFLHDTKRHVFTKLSYLQSKLVGIAKMNLQNVEIQKQNESNLYGITCPLL